MHSSPRQSLSVLGIGVDAFESYDHAVAEVAGIVAEGRKAWWVAVNPQKVYRALHDRAVHEAISIADARICDGVGVSLAIRLLNGEKVRRCTGCDLFGHLIGAAAQRGWRVFLLGASPAANERACERLLDTHPGLHIVGRRDGYFDDSQEVIRQINQARTDLLFVAMGSPKQEFWIARNRQAIDAPFCLGVGGTLDVASGLVARAPTVFRRTGTEFLYQLVTQPRRWRRQIVYFPYVFHVLKEALKRKTGRTPSLSH